MTIDISNRPDKNIRQFTITQKDRQGYSMTLLVVITLMSIAVDCIGIAFSVSLNIILYIILRLVGQLSIPLACYITAFEYRHTKDVRKAALILGALTIFSHIPYVYLNTGSFGILSRTSIMFPLFMGYSALMVRDMAGIDTNVKSAVMLLVCLISAVGHGGCASAVWIYIFGSDFSKNTQIKYFAIAGAVMIIINLILNLTNGFWYTVIYQLGIFLAIPFILKDNSYKAKCMGKQFYCILYPIILLLIAIIRYIVL